MGAGALQRSAILAVSAAVFSVAVARLISDSTLELYEVAWQPEPTKIYIGSPSLLRLNNGDIMMSCDRFGKGFKTERNTSVFLSNDNGVGWRRIHWVKDQYWSNLFRLDETSQELYLLGTSTDGPAPIKISRSHDNGMTWPDTTVLFGEISGNESYQTGPTPSLIFGNRVYRAVERMRPPYEWPTDFEAVVMSASVYSDLVDPESWTKSAPLPFNESWIPDSWDPKPEMPGYLEGNAVAGPDGIVYNLLRLNSKPYIGNYAVLLKYDQVENVLLFDSIVSMPGGHSKFVVRFDPATRLYLTLSNPNTDANYTDQRNILSLCSSPDLRNWTEHTVVLHDDTGFNMDDSVRYTGFHYVDWQIDGDNLILAVRTAYRGANSYHNANRISFKKIEDFRSLLSSRVVRRPGCNKDADDFDRNFDNYFLDDWFSRTPSTFRNESRSDDCAEENFL